MTELIQQITFNKYTSDSDNFECCMLLFKKVKFLNSILILRSINFYVVITAYIICEQISWLGCAICLIHSIENSLLKLDVVRKVLYLQKCSLKLIFNMFK